ATLDEHSDGSSVQLFGASGANGHKDSRHTSGLWHQRVTARFGDQDGRAGGVFLDLLPQPVDVCLERRSGAPGMVAPDFLQQWLARYRTLAGTTKISQAAGLLLREPRLVTLVIEQEFRARPERVGADGEDGVLARLVVAQVKHGKA